MIDHARTGLNKEEKDGDGYFLEHEGSDPFGKIIGYNKLITRAPCFL
jgi:hypothetical protein